MNSSAMFLRTIAVAAAVVVAMPAAGDPGDRTAPPLDTSRLGDDVGFFAPETASLRDDAGWQERGPERRAERRRGRGDRDERRDRDRGRRGGPFRGQGGETPAFCRSGEGHPVFGMSWCHGNREGPAFCRTGEGHPRFGIRWCFEKGFVPGAARWRQYDPGDIVFDRRPRRRAERRPLGERILDDILGEVVFGRLVSHRDAIGIDGRLEGRWYASRDRSPARVLQVRAGRLPLAEFIDLDGDGRVDMALVLEP